MDERIMKQVRFVLEDDGEVLVVASGPGIDLDEENKRMNRELIRDANEIHLNDEDNIAGHHKEAVALNEWLEQRIELSKEETMKVLEGRLEMM